MNFVNYSENEQAKWSNDQINDPLGFLPVPSIYISFSKLLLYSLIFVIGLLGNLLTGIVIICNASMHTTINYNFFSLAVSDLLLLVSGIPLEVYYIWIKQSYIFGHNYCIRGVIAEISKNASIITFCVLSIERYIAVTRPFVSRRQENFSRARNILMFVWTIAIVLALIQGFQFQTVIHNQVEMCVQTKVIIPHSSEIFTFLLFILPLFLNSFLYYRIWKTITTTQPELNATRGQVDARKTFFMIVAVVVVFFFCWLPFHTQRLFAVYGTSSDHHAKSPIIYNIYICLTYISGPLCYMSACINPILYNMMSEKFKEAYKQTMRRLCCTSANETNEERNAEPRTAQAINIEMTQFN